MSRIGLQQLSALTRLLIPVTRNDAAAQIGALLPGDAQRLGCGRSFPGMRNCIFAGLRKLG